MYASKTEKCKIQGKNEAENRNDEEKIEIKKNIFIP